ncbi:TonB-dependent receptor [Fulvivirga sp. M361]|uniref:TonB-dependent receptor n=1 Tax=Fulvivirga sp. M361 TaxID=2594266 RepID=UPI001179ABA2|nr:TonB-dependent receptor plug domain-containing protein [Fulvivirga sp. M361]TRX54327.1 TonB-dependent receptor [Fulvivirga sp. M361]
MYTRYSSFFSLSQLKSLLFFYALIGTPALLAQPNNANVKFKVLDSNKDKIPGAYVEVLGTDFKGISDTNGEVRFALELDRSYSIKVAYLGFEDLIHKVQISRNTTSIRLNLKEKVTELDQVVIKGGSERDRVLKQPHKAAFISLENIRSQPVEVVNIINQMPGMRIRQNGGVGSEVNISINGIGGKGVKTFIDEIPVSLLGAGYSLNNISQGIIENIEVYKGTIPIKFGSDALGGVINITTRQKNSDYLDLSYSYGSWNTHQTTLGLNKRFGKDRKFGVSLEGFQTYSNNNYWMDDVLVKDELTSKPGITNTKRGRARRFNDTFDSKLVRLTIGARNLSWADEIQLHSTLSNVDREWQHGVTAENPWGEAFSEEDSWSTALTWKKFGKDDRWDINLSSGFITNQLAFVDTTRKTYRWDQSFEPRPSGLQGESGIFSNGTTPLVDKETYFIRQSANLAIDKQHSLNLTALFTRDALRAANRAFSQENQQGLGEPQYLLKNYTGLALQSELFHSALTNIISVKHFYQQSEAISFEFDEVGPTEQNVYSMFGYGNVLQYHINPSIVANLGYEFTVRQPDSDELFGDFIRIIPNPGLRPEESQNINSGIGWTSKNKKIKVGSSFFYRNTSNKVFLIVADRANSQYENLSRVETTGVEINGSFQPISTLKFSLNATYQNAIAKELDTSRGFSTSSIGERVPNEPYFFSNFIADYSIPKLPVSKGKIKLLYSLNYVNSFLIAWDQNAIDQSNTPSQTIHNLSAAWLAPKEKWSVGFECRNLFDALAFDNFEVQKPGRSFYVKARIFLERI